MASRLSGVFKQRKSASSPKSRRKKAKNSDLVHAAYQDGSSGTASFGAGATQPAALVTSRGADVAEDHDDVEDLLRQFDLNTSFGPCLGLSRLDRWERAERLGLKPPHHVKDILERVGGEPNCLWEGRV